MPLAVTLGEFELGVCRRVINTVYKNSSSNFKNPNLNFEIKIVISNQKLNFKIQIELDLQL